MKEISGYLGLPVFLLVSVWGLLKTTLDVIARLNETRDFCLGYAAGAKAFPREVRLAIFQSDWIPLWLGLTLALTIFAAVFAMLPRLFQEMHADQRGEQARWAAALMRPVIWRISHIQLACYGFAVLALGVAIAHFMAGFSDWRLVEMRAC